MKRAAEMIGRCQVCHVPFVLETDGSLPIHMIRFPQRCDGSETKRIAREEMPKKSKVTA